MTAKDIDFNKDYYNILGLGKDATQDDIKKAFRKMSVLWHPDKHTNDPEDKRKEAEDKFKECNEAYSILSDENLKKAYDAGPNMGFDFETDGMNSMWEYMNPFGDQDSIGDDVIQNIKVTLDDIKNGINNRTIKYFRNIRCTCCHGTGALETKECQHCHGTGLINKEEEYTLTAKPEHLIKNGTALYVGPAGSESKKPGGQNGGLMFKVIHDLPSNLSIQETAPGCFSMVNTMKMPYWDLLLGKTVTVETPYGSKLAIKIPEQCESGHPLRARGKGFVVNGYTGDYIIVPERIKTAMKDEEREHLMEIKRLHEKNNESV